MKGARFFLPFLLLVAQTAVIAQLRNAQSGLDSILHSVNGVLGVAAIDVSTGDTIVVNGERHYPMQSVFKFPLALAVLHRVDCGRDSLKELFHISRADLPRGTHSPLRDSHPDTDFTMRLDTLLWYMVALSDNNVCDYFFRYCGGTDSVQAYIRALGITDMSIVATEAGMAESWDVQYRNWSTPMAMARLLEKFVRHKVPGPAGHDFLLRTMAGSPTGPGRIRGFLPKSTIVAHKTGSSGPNEQGLAAATNDAGVIVLPGGRKIVLVVFLSDSTADEKTRDTVIATVAKIIWDAMVGR
jgi:beta-lactamase class A